MPQEISDNIPIRPRTPGPRQWLSPLDFGEKQNTTFEKHAPDTGEWFLEHSKFLAWTRGEFKTLWCPGNPGVGKSIMASLVIHKLGEVISEDIALVFIYFEYSKATYTMTQLAEAILKQLSDGKSHNQVWSHSGSTSQAIVQHSTTSSVC
ncbi:hypothetical protein BD779DRAFT_1464179 [Infundibulicybe gibba]|nr:hypothetical protein BD779DRAFT_1464179 [Infundibulicybe gibba]